MLPKIEPFFRAPPLGFIQDRAPGPLGADRRRLGPHGFVLPSHELAPGTRAVLGLLPVYSDPHTDWGKACWQGIPKLEFRAGWRAALSSRSDQNVCPGMHSWSGMVARVVRHFNCGSRSDNSFPHNLCRLKRQCTEEKGGQLIQTSATIVRCRGLLSEYDSIHR